MLLCNWKTEGIYPPHIVFIRHICREIVPFRKTVEVAFLFFIVDDGGGCSGNVGNASVK